MKWLRLILALFLLAGSTLLPVGVAFASTVGDVSLFATPLFTNGILTFTITYVTDTRLDLDWTVGANVSAVMIRAKYHQYPADIPDNVTAPSDGYLVYYGALLHASDTSMNFDENPGPLYYRAWAQLSDGSWVVSPKEGWKESKEVILLAILATAGLLSFLGYKNPPMRVIASGAWIFVMLYWIQSPPSTITRGSSADTAAIAVFGLASATMMFWPFFTARSNGSEVSGRFRINLDRLLGREEPPPSRSPSRAARAQAYQDILNGVNRGERRNQY